MTTSGPSFLSPFPQQAPAFCLHILIYVPVPLLLLSPLSLPLCSALTFQHTFSPCVILYDPLIHAPLHDKFLETEATYSYAHLLKNLSNQSISAGYNNIDELYCTHDSCALCPHVEPCHQALAYVTAYQMGRQQQTRMLPIDTAYRPEKALIQEQTKSNPIGLKYTIVNSRKGSTLKGSQQRFENSSFTMY